MIRHSSFILPLAINLSCFHLAKVKQIVNALGPLGLHRHPQGKKNNTNTLYLLRRDIFIYFIYQYIYTG